MVVVLPSVDVGHDPDVAGALEAGTSRIVDARLAATALGRAVSDSLCVPSGRRLSRVVWWTTSGSGRRPGWPRPSCAVSSLRLTAAPVPLEASSSSPARRSAMVFSRRAPGEVDQPADGQGGRTAGPDLDRDLVGGPADPAALGLQLGPDVVDRALERGHGVAAGLAPALLERRVDDPLGGGALPLEQDLVHHLGHELRLVDRVGRELPAAELVPSAASFSSLTCLPWRRSAAGLLAVADARRCRGCRG